MKRLNTAAIALAAAGVAQAFAEAGEKVAGFNDALERQRKENEREEKRARRFVHFEERPKGKGEGFSVALSRQDAAAYCGFTNV